MAGYQESRYSFTARGGSYIYSSEEGFRDDIGSFPNGESEVAHLNTAAGWKHLITMSTMTQEKESLIAVKSKTKITILLQSMQVIT